MTRDIVKPFLLHLIIFSLIQFNIPVLNGQETEILYLSGTGNDHTVDWQFYCTGGRQSGKWTTIPVPSNWELQGFGTYNYGHDKDSLRGKEKGLYKHRFDVQADWKGKTVHIVFEGSMTDTEVKINGQPAGPIHQGSFYRFKYDISGLLNYGKENLLEATVSKHSSNESVNAAERLCDYWIFGGIFRPVYLEVLPKEHISRIALNALSDGRFYAEVVLGKTVQAGEVMAQIYTPDGQKVGSRFSTTIKRDDPIVHLQSNIPTPLPWSPEFPNLYKVIFTLLANGKPLHIVSERFGFRTIELRERDGIYLNGTRIKFRGVCRHSFWPSSGRTLSKELSIIDVELMKDMNMNAVRNSHYPADAHFLNVCDSLGLLVLDELAGWHDAYDTKTGSVLVAEMMASNVNHPSIVMWINGNEGGHNPDLDLLFDSMDIQRRPVIHAWEIFRGIDTQHYINYDYGNGTHLHGHDVVCPTEFLHGLYDGGHGAGLEDYWEQMWHHPLSAGGFLWDFSDEGVVRTDRNGETDTDGDHAADGILGPYREKEGSYYTIKEIWSPVFFEHREITPAFDGAFRVENRFFFINLNQCKFTWKLARMPGPLNNEKTVFETGTIPSPDILPGHKGILALRLPVNWQDYDVLYVTAYDPYNREIFTWSWPVSRPAQIAKKILSTEGSGTVQAEETDSLLHVTANGITISFNQKTGLLQQVHNEKGTISFKDGPVLCEGEADYQSMTCRRKGENMVVQNIFGEKSHFKELKWTIYPSGWLKLELEYCPGQYESTLMGVSFSYPEQLVRGVRWMGDGPYRVWKNRIKGTQLDVWEKEYNNTITGQGELIYPEFKGYHSRFYWARILTDEQDFTVVTCNEDIFLRLFTPAVPQKPYNTAPPFPTGDISFMHGITPIGTKSQVPEKMGPMGQKNMFYTYGNTRCKALSLYFDFSGK